MFFAMQYHYRDRPNVKMTAGTYNETFYFLLEDCFQKSEYLSVFR
jgi:hypothetical protein